MTKCQKSEGKLMSKRDSSTSEDVKSEMAKFLKSSKCQLSGQCNKR